MVYRIHKEGYLSIIITVLFIIILNILIYYFVPSTLVGIIVGAFSFVLFIFMLFFFRLPSRLFTSGKEEIIAPADGKVVVIEEVDEPEYFKDKRLQVSIFMSPLNVHVNRSPITGEIKYVKYHPGQYLVAWHPKSSTLNERYTTVVGNEKQEVLVRQIAGKLARRIVNYTKEGQKINQNDEIGFIKFGSRVDLFLPLETKVNVQIDDVVKGGITSIGTFNATI